MIKFILVVFNNILYEYFSVITSKHSYVCEGRLLSV